MVFNVIMTMRVLILLLGVFSYVHCQNESSSESKFISERIAFGVRELLKTGRKTMTLLNDVNELRNLKDYVQKNVEVCKSCNLVVNLVIKARRDGLTEEQFQKYAYDLCMMMSSWGSVACQGYVRIEKDALLYMIDNKTDLTGKRVCSMYLQQYNCKDPGRKPWTIVIPPRNDFETSIKTPANAHIDKVLHLTDFHYDPLYEPGSAAVCDFQLCCQKSSGKPNKPEEAAGYWGDYHVCDMPWHAVLNVLNHIKQHHSDVKVVYYTGDIIAHRSWDTTEQSNSETITALFNQFRKTFGNVPVYPVLGNHEPHPTDFWAAFNTTNQKLSTQWLFDLSANLWSKWLPASALETIKIGGYYTVLVRPGFRIIALNSNVCYKSNLWLFFDDVDPYDQLQWLADVLKQAEDHNEVVHLLGHVPPGSVECLDNWNEVFHKIVERFSHVIKAQFNGHTHYDELRVFYDKEKENVINVAYNGGSFTTYIGVNPNYRVYDVNHDSLEVVDYEEWIYNITEANQTPERPPRWYKLYSFKDAYGMKSMRFPELKDLVDRMTKNITLVEEYFRFLVRDSDVKMAKGCDKECLQAKLCSIRSTHFSDSYACHDDV